MKHIDSAVVVDSRVMTVDATGKEVETTIRHTYLFCGHQFFRYAGTDYTFVEEGYPLTIRTALQSEPRFMNLKAPVQPYVDAAFADEHNVYLVQGKTLLVISDSAARLYDLGSDTEVEAAVIDEGSLYVLEQGTWYVRNNPEMETPELVEELPPLLEDVPEVYQTGLSAILQGTDENTYLFKGPNCYDVLLGNVYPTGEAWGTVRNSIVEENLVEAAFLGQDGKTYLFCGDQFVSYLPGTAVAMANNVPLIDGLPQPIAGNWGGLTNVRYAYVQQGVTYVAEKPAADGTFRIVRYSTADYSKPDKGYPRTVDFDWWDIPQSYQEDGFTRVDAVLADEHNLFLMQGQEFIQFNYGLNLWHYARPINQVWRALAFNDDTFSSILAAFQGSDGLVYFFSQGTFAAVPHNTQTLLNPAPAGTTVPLLDIKLHWGHVANHLADTGIVDAAFVECGQETYLFSGPEYVKYSTNDYRHVDEGYPKLIWQSLRQEGRFAQLPDTFESTMQSRASQGQGLSAAVANKGSVYLFINNTLLVVSKDLQRSYDIGVLGKMTNRIVENNAIDAAYVNAQGQVVLLAGDQAFAYSDPDEGIVDEGYPKKIRDLLAEEGFGSIDPTFTSDLDAVLRAARSGTLYLFKGQHYVGSDDPQTLKQINAGWGNVRNNFVPVGTATNMAVDAAFVSPNGMTFLFKGDQFIRYANFAQVFVDEGFPLPIRDNWGNLPVAYEAGVNGGFVFEGKTYLLSNGAIAGQYVRYSRPEYRKIDSVSPQTFAVRAARWGDYLLDDMKQLSFFKQKVDQTSSGTHSITDFLNVTTADQLDPYAALNAMFGWDSAQVKWIQRNNAFLALRDPEETRLDLEMIERMSEIFGTTQRLGADPSSVYAEVWQLWFDQALPPDVQTAADNLYRYLANKTSETDWATLQQQIHDELNLIQRDLFIPLCIALDPSLTLPKDLYDLLLIDVLMGSQARTSKVAEAISAIQLYFHRYFVNLEQLDIAQPGLTAVQVREQLKEEWKWLKNYRVWEANRQVFLYPENYIRPELRSTKTTEFKDLETTLLQGDITLDTVEAAYTAYLESFGVVSNLKIAGASVYDVGVYQNGGERVLALFGHTRMQPRQFYCRTASYAKQAPPHTGDLAVWNPWEKVDQTIDADRVFPIMANGRLMLFWNEIKDIEESDGKIISQPATEMISQVNVTQKRLRQEANIKYALRRYDGHWTPPQQIKNGIDLVYKIDAAYCEGANDSVIVTFCGAYCQKTTQATQEVEAKRIKEFDEFQNLPESFKSGIDAATIFNGKRYLFKAGQCVVQENGQAQQNLSLQDLIAMPVVQNQNAMPLLTVSPGTYGNGESIMDQSTDNQQKAELLLSSGVSAAFVLTTGMLNAVQVVMAESLMLGQMDNTSFPLQQTSLLIPGQTVDILTLVDMQGNYSFYQQGGDGKFYSIQSLSFMLALFPHFPQMIATLTMRDGQFRQPDAVFRQGQVYYVIRDGQYECYNQVGNDLMALDGFPKPLRGNVNFNMDDFFSELHLTQSEDGVYLSYGSPKDQLLLYGKLKADFTFSDIPIQTDRALVTVLGWNTFLQNNVQDYSSYRSADIASRVSDFIANFQAQRANIAAVLALQAAIAQLNSALESAQQILPQETTNDGQDIPAVDQLQGQIQANMQAITDGLTPFQQQKTLLADIRSLLEFVPTLSPGGAIDRSKRRRRDKNRKR